jgi:hypothetical protein
MGVLTFVVKLKYVALHTNVKFSENFYLVCLRKMSVIIGNGYCFHLLTLFS